MRARPVRILQLAPSCPTGVRLPELDRLKGFALVLVLLYHGGGALGYDNWLHGDVGVDLFLIASGFVLALNSTALTAGEFLKRRLLRVYPSYWIVLGLFLWANARFFADRRPAIDIVLHVLGLHGFSRPAYFSDINDSFWFISILVLLYAVFFGLRRRLHDLGLVVGVGCWVTTAACVFYTQTHSDGGMSHLAVRVPDLFLGMIFGHLAAGRPLEIRYSWFAASGALALIYLAILRGADFAYPLVGMGWIVVFLCAERRLTQFRLGRALAGVLAFLGIYSYEIYLLHQPLIRDYSRLAMAQWWQIVNPTRPQVLAGMTGAFLLVLALSILLHRGTDWLFGSLRKSSLR